MEIHNELNLIDSRDIIARLKELELDFEIYLEESDNNIEEEFCDFAEDWSSANDWEYDAFFINEDYFTEYAKDMIEDIGDLPRDLPSYIENNIDWEGVANDLLYDYENYDFDGVTFYCK